MPIPKGCCSPRTPRVGGCSRELISLTTSRSSRPSPPAGPCSGSTRWATLLFDHGTAPPDFCPPYILFSCCTIQHEAKEFAMTASNDTQRVLLSEQFEDDLYYTATVTLERTEVCFNRDSVVFVRLASDQAPVRLSLTAGE